MHAELISLGRLRPASWNANRMSRATRAKVRRSIEEFGVVENLVARPHPVDASLFEVISGNHRLAILGELGHIEVPVVVVMLDDTQARILAQTLNRTRGTDDPVAYQRLLEELLMKATPGAVAQFLPEAQATLEQILLTATLDDSVDPDAVCEPPLEPDSQPGELYELGLHRLICGDATDPAVIARLMGGEAASVMVTDPPYGVSVDHTWRDGLRQPIGAARSGVVANDDRFDWEAAYALTDAPVAYVWHSALFAGEVKAGLAAAGFEARQQIIWLKAVHALGRAAYQWKHETCWYAVRKGASANWKADRSQTTVWEAASPIMAYGGGQDDQRTPHPTQKPVAVFTPPIANHTIRGDIVFDPFAGSGTILVAAAQLGRRAYMVEVDPAYCDVIRKRHAAWSGRGG